MDDAYLSAIEARALAATSGPWDEAHVLHRGMCEVAEVGTFFIRSAAMDDRMDDGSFRDGQFHARAPANARFIAHARADIPALVAEVHRLQALLAAKA